MRECRLTRVATNKWNAGALPQREEFQSTDLFEVCHALALYGSTPTDVTFAQNDGTSMVAGGHDDRFVVVFFSGDENWHLQTELPPASNGTMRLTVGGQEGEFEPKMLVTRAEMTSVMSWYASIGKMWPDLTWIKDV